MRHYVAKTVTCSLLPIVLGGCGSTPQHTNTLLFGTTTKLALDVSVNPAGGTPDFTLGYKRHEGVWMPLLANQEAGETTKPANCPDCVFAGTEKNGERKDTYSVLASFGATFGGGAESKSSGEGPAASASGKGGLAQFFATGIAAQKLAQEGNSRLVAVQPVDEQQLKDAEARASAAEQKTGEVEAKLMKLVGEESYKTAIETGAAKSSLLIARKNIVLASVAPGGKLDKSGWDNVVSRSTLTDDEKSKLKSQMDYQSVDERLTVDAAMTGSIINALYDAVK